nr:unnamed protein product [Callosobruchus analis]
MGGEEFENKDTMPGQRNLKTECDTSPTFAEVTIKNENPSGAQHEQLILETQDCSVSAELPNKLIKTEEAETDTYTDQAEYMDIEQLNRELNIKDENCTTLKSSYLPLER